MSTIPRKHTGETVECNTCGWQGGRNETDAGHCPNCGDECYSLEEIYQPGASDMTTTKLDLIQAPALDHDAMMASRFGSKLDQRMLNERAVVWTLCQFLDGHGFDVISVHDGVESTKVSTAKEAMELLFNLDEGVLRVRKQGFNRQQGIWFIFGNGNEGWDVISDHSYDDADIDGFNQVMDGFYDLTEHWSGQ